MAKLAINGGTPVRGKPFCSWPIVDRETALVADVVRAGTWGHLFCEVESKVDEFRERFAKYHGSDYAIPVTNGSVALEIALRNAGIGYGDEVITPPTTWVATNLAPVVVGADPVFADVGPRTYCLDPGAVEAALTPRTKAIIPVHIGGYPCDMAGIMAVAKQHGLAVIEDCAQAHGTRIDGKLVGTFGQFGCFSFELSKLMTSGEGGAVIMNDDALGDQVWGLSGEAGRQFAKVFARPRRNVGWNSRMTEMQAAILLVQLSRLDEQKAVRQANAAHLSSRLSGVPGIEPLPDAPDQNYYSYIFKYDSDGFKGLPKARFTEALVAEGIELFSSPSHQPPAYRSPKFYSPRRDYSRVLCPVAEKAFTEEAVGLRATWTLLGPKRDMDDIADAVVKIQGHVDEIPRSPA